MADSQRDQRPGRGPWAHVAPADAAGAAFLPFPAAAVEGSIGERLFDVASRFGASIALRSPAGEWTYEQLAADVRRHAGGLVAELGTDAEPVALVVGHDGPLVVALLSVIVAGH